MSLPRPYYERDGITIYHGDCLEILPALHVATVDLMLTDPPYGIALRNHGRNQNDYTITGDESQDVGQSVIDSLATLPTIAFASPMRPWLGKWRQHLVWDKGPAVGYGGDIATCWKPCWELIQVRKNKPLNGPRDSAVLRFHVGSIKATGHPAEKPIELIRYLVGKASMPGDMILDPFMGSGTTLRAALDLGRQAIGIETEERYCEIAARRLEQAVMPLEVSA